MKISISLPNDHGSESNAALMLEDLYDSDTEAAESDECRKALDMLADIARMAGLRFVAETDFGAIWDGTQEDCATCRATLPSWAHVGEVE